MLILRMATSEGASAIGLGDEVGSLEPGKKADFILVHLNRPQMLPVLWRPVRNIVPNLVLPARGDEVSLSIIDGKIICENGRILTIEESEALAHAQKSGEEVSQAAESVVRERNTFQYRVTQQGKY